jgi:hypothetical protein
MVYAAPLKISVETGLEVEVTGLVGICSDPRHVIACTVGEGRRCSLIRRG